MDHPGEPVHSGEVVLRQRVAVNAMQCFGSVRTATAVSVIAVHSAGSRHAGNNTRANRRHQRSPRTSRSSRQTARVPHRHRQVAAGVTIRVPLRSLRRAIFLRGNRDQSSPPPGESRQPLCVHRALPVWRKESDQQRRPFCCIRVAGVVVSSIRFPDPRF